MEINKQLWFGVGVIEECFNKSIENMNCKVYILRIKHLNGFMGSYWYAGVANFPFEKGKLVTFQFDMKELFKEDRELKSISLS